MGKSLKSKDMSRGRHIVASAQTQTLWNTRMRWGPQSDNFPPKKVTICPQFLMKYKDQVRASPWGHQVSDNYLPSIYWHANACFCAHFSSWKIFSKCYVKRVFAGFLHQNSYLALRLSSQLGSPGLIRPAWRWDIKCDHCSFCWCLIS